MAEKGTVKIAVDAHDAQAKITDAAASIAWVKYAADYGTAFVEYDVESTFLDGFRAGAEWAAKETSSIR